MDPGDRKKPFPDGLKGDPRVLVAVDILPDKMFERPRFPGVPDGLQPLLRGLQLRTVHVVPDRVVVVPGRERVFMDDACQQARLERRLHDLSPRLDQGGGTSGRPSG